MHGILRGLAAGLAATIPMTVAMVTLRRFEPEHVRDEPLPPSTITRRAADRVGIADKVSEETKSGATVVAHFGYGAAVGGLYGAVADRIPGPPLVRGAAYGLAVWGGSYMGWLPVARLFPAASRVPGPRNAVMIAAHVVWGATAGLLESRLRLSDPRAVRAGPASEPAAVPRAQSRAGGPRRPETGRPIARAISARRSGGDG